MTLETAIATIATLEQEISALREANATLQAINTQLAKQLATLEQRVAETSQTSNRPPSSDSVYRGPKRRKQGEAKAKRKRRHRKTGHARALLPDAQVDSVVPVTAQICAHCGGRLGQSDRQRRRDYRHQVTEMCQRGVMVTDYQLHRSHCQRCKRFTRAALPPGVTRHAFGPKLTGLVATLTVTYRLSKRNVQALLLEVFGVTISRGAITACERRVSAAAEAAVVEATCHLQAAKVAYADETPWKHRHELQWLWAGGTGPVWVFQIHDSRKKTSAQALLGDRFDGTLVADDYAAYRHITRRQQCWSHLLRRFAKLQTFKRDAVAVAVGDEGARLIAKMLALYRHYRQGTVARSIFARTMRRHKMRMLALVRYGQQSASSWTKSRCAAIAKMGDALWAFAGDPDRIEPTNNASERAIRHAVLIRKASLGTQSESGRTFVSRMLTLTQSLRRQGRSVLSFVQQTMVTWTRGTKQPSVLPQPAAM